MKEYKVFCKECGELITNQYYDMDSDSTVYTCDECGELTENEVAVAEFAVGDVVKWEDPCSDDYATDDDYYDACEQLRTVTDVWYNDGIIYELDNGTEVFEDEVWQA